MCAASPNLSQNAHGNRGTVTKEKAAWQAGLQSWGLRMGGSSVPVGFLYFPYVCTEPDPSNYVLADEETAFNCGSYL